MSKNIELLQNLLASYAVFTQNTRDFHWNIRGKNFFTLHEKLEELYNDLSEKADEVAELILTLGEKPETRFSAYLEISQIKEAHGVSDDTLVAQSVVNSLQILMDSQQAILDKADDEAVAGLMSDNVREQKKLQWMYKAYLG